MNKQIEDFYMGDVITCSWFPDTHRVAYWSQMLGMIDIAFGPHGQHGVASSINTGACTVTLKKRGNGFRHRFGLRLLPFHDYVDECVFWRSMGLFKEVPNPSTGHFAWTPREALKALRRGTIDVALYSHGITGVSFFSGYRVLDPEGAERVRTQCISDLMSQPALVD